MDNRRKLIDMATGTRSGYWVEILHDETGAECYELHRPEIDGNLDDVFTCTWEALQIFADFHAGPGSADTLDRYDDGRTAQAASVMGPKQAAALVKWAKK